MEEKYVYVFLEISELEDNTTIFTTLSEKPYVEIIKKFNFKSSKSIVKFLNKNKEYILTNIPNEEVNLLYQLEEQNFLEYLDIKWFQLNDFSKEKLSPDQILDISLKFRAIKEKELLDYIMEPKNNYIYEIYKSKLE